MGVFFIQDSNDDHHDSNSSAAISTGGIASDSTTTWLQRNRASMTLRFQASVAATTNKKHNCNELRVSSNNRHNNDISTTCRK